VAKVCGRSTTEVGLNLAIRLEDDVWQRDFYPLIFQTSSFQQKMQLAKL
jgi:hypothetical protein